MLKGKKYDWKDSNMALFGSPLEREVKEAAAGKTGVDRIRARNWTRNLEGRQI